MVGFLPAVAPAQIWTGGVSTTWSAAGNWSGGVPGAAATATFNSNTANDPNLTGAAAVGKLQFDSGSDAETFTGSTLTLNGVSSVGLENLSGVTQTFNNTLSVAAAQTWNAGSGDLVFSAVSVGGNLTLTGSSAFAFTGTVTLTNNRTLTNDATGAVTFSGNITGTNRTLTAAGSGDTTLTGALTLGSGALIKTGTGTLTMSGANTYTGANTVGTAGGTSGGTLRLGNANALSNNTTTVYAGTLDLNGYDDTIGALTLGGGASGTTAAVTTGAGTLTLGGNVTYTATNNPNGATISGNLALGGANRTFTVNNSSGAADDLTVSAVISGGNNLVKAGTGTLVLSGANTYTGTTSVSAGVLNLRHSQALGSTGAGTTVTTGEELQLQDNISVGAEALSITGTGVSSTGALRNISGSNTYGGLITLTGNTQVTADAGDLTLSGGFTGSSSLTLTGAGNITISGDISLAGGTLAKRDAGLLVLSGTNSSTGATTIGTSGGAAAGTVRLGAANGLSSGTLTLYAGTLDLNGHDDTIGALNLGGGAAGTTATVTTGAGTVTLGGNLTYSATNNADGAVISGRLDLGGANRTFNIGNSTAVADDVVIDAVISGSAGINKATSAGTLVLTGANTYTGLTQVTAGVLNIRHAQALGTTDAGTVVTSGDELQVQGGIAVGNETLSLAGTGVSSTGALRNVSGDNSWAGAVTLTNTTQINADAGNLTLSGGVTGTNRSLTLDGAGGFSIAAITTGAGNLTKAGGGTATLTGTNTYTGDTTVSAGVLRLGTGATLHDTSDVVVAAGATFDVNGQTDSVRSIAGAGDITLGSGALTTAGTASTTYSGVMSGTGSFTKEGSATLTLSGANTYNGATTVSAGILRIGATESLADTTAVSVAAGATFDVNDLAETVATIAGAGAIDLGSGSLTTAGNGSTAYSGVMTGTGSFTKQGSGTLTLSGANNYTGATTVGAGTLLLGAANVLSNSTAVTVSAGATLDLAGVSETIATLAGGGIVDLGGGALTTAGNGSTTFSGDLDGGGTFTKQGTGVLTLDNDFSFDGTFNLAGGTLRLSDIALSLTTLNITGNSIIDFAGVSSLSVTNFSLSGGVTLTIQNWADASDYFFAQNWSGATFNTSGAAPMNQVTFTGFAASDTKWQEYDRQITPVPEPSTYGALLLALAGGLLAGRRLLRRPAG